MDRYEKNQCRQSAQLAGVDAGWRLRSDGAGAKATSAGLFEVCSGWKGLTGDIKSPGPGSSSS